MDTNLELSQDPADRLEMAQVQEAAAGRQPPEMKPEFDEKLKMWKLTVSPAHQVFRGRTLEELVSVLGRAQWFASEHIRHQTHLLKERFANTDSSDFSILSEY